MFNIVIDGRSISAPPTKLARLVRLTDISILDLLLENDVKATSSSLVTSLHFLHNSVTHTEVVCFCWQCYLLLSCVEKTCGA